MSLAKIKSAISAVRETLQAVRELSVATKEVVEITRDRGLLVDKIAWLRLELELANEANSQILRELGWNKSEPPEPGRIRREMDGLFEELAVEKHVGELQWDWAKERIVALQSQITEEHRLYCEVYDKLRAWELWSAGELTKSNSGRPPFPPDIFKSTVELFADHQNKLDLQWDAVKAMEKERDEALPKLARYEAAETWLSRWRWNKMTSCPFPPDTFVQYREYEQVTPSSPNENHDNEPLKEMSHTCMVSELADSDEWRPHVECLQFYEEFKDV